MTDTPETDNLARRNHVVPTEFAQQLERELATVTEQRDRLAEALQSIRDGYGGQMTDPDCGCGDCEFLIQIDEALQCLTPNEL